MNSLAGRVSPTYIRPECMLDLSAEGLKAAYQRYKLSIHRERFGQWLCNNYLKEGHDFPALFYQRNAGTAYNLALANILGDKYDEIESE